MAVYGLDGMTVCMGFGPNLMSPTKPGELFSPLARADDDLVLISRRKEKDAAPVYDPRRLQLSRQGRHTNKHQQNWGLPGTRLVNLPSSEEVVDDPVPAESLCLYFPILSVRFPCL